MDSLEAAIDAVEDRRQTIEVYAVEGDVATELRRQFSTRNVDVIRRQDAGSDPGFVVIRGPDGRFEAALGVEHLAAIVSPEIHPPWTLGESDVDLAEVFAFLDDTVFTSYDRRQMLAVAREIEERAWRVDDGRMYVGFQRAEAFAQQRPVYDRFDAERDVSISVFVDDAWPADRPKGFDLVEEAGGEIGRFWFVVFDGGGSDLNTSGLLAEERESGQYRGFWTDDPERVAELVSYLESTYLG